MNPWLQRLGGVLVVGLWGLWLPRIKDAGRADGWVVVGRRNELGALRSRQGGRRENTNDDCSIMWICRS